MTKKNVSNVLMRLVIYMKPWWGGIAAISALSAGSSLLNVVVPHLTKKISDEISHGITGSMDESFILKNLVVAVVFLLLAFLFNILQAYISPIITQKCSCRMRREVNEKSDRVPLNYFDTTPDGETISTMTNDVDQVATSFGTTLSSLITAVATFVGCLVMMFLASRELAATTIVSSILGVLLSAVLVGSGARFFKERQNRLARLNSAINEDISGHFIIKSFSAEKEIIEDFENLNHELYASTWKSQFITSMMMTISTLSGNLSYIAVCVAGALLVIHGRTEVGTIIAFILYAQMFQSAMSTLMQTSGTIQPALAAGERIFRFLDLEEMADEGKRELETAKVRGCVDFEHVRFGYHPENIIIRDFSLHVEPGQKVAIVGPTGAGKSTLVNLLTRFYEVNGGNIRLDGIPINEMSRRTLHRCIGMVLQDTWTFEGTIRSNIVYAKEKYSEEDLKRVCEDAGIADFIRTLPNGIDTRLGEDCGVSAGQRQLITIARAMLDNAPILILDEATSNVDTRTEKIITGALDLLMKDRTSFVIAHRLSTIRNADTILVLKDGDIVEMGSHNELMNKNGFYADLYLSQFENKKGEEE